MSAYVLEAEKIERLVAWICGLRQWQEHAHRLRLMGYDNATTTDRYNLAVDMLAMNQDAVMARYPDCDATNLPGPIDPKPITFGNMTRPRPYTVGEAFGVLRSFLYQCSEGEVPESDLYLGVYSVLHSLACKLAEHWIKQQYPEARLWA